VSWWVVEIQGAKGEGGKGVLVGVLGGRIQRLLNRRDYEEAR